MQERFGASRNKRPAYLAGDEDVADLVEAWLDRHGLMSVPIPASGGAGGAVATARAPSVEAANPRSEVAGFADRVDDALAARRNELAEERITVGPLDIDPARREVHFAGAQVHVTPTEFRLLRRLAERSDRVVGHRELLTVVWGPGYESELHLLQVTVRSLRSRIALVTDRPVVETAYGAGYRIADLRTMRHRR